jgi:peptide/nickel transport system substrate-binding protein
MAMTLLLAACGSAGDDEADEPTDGEVTEEARTVVVAYGADITGLDPQVSSGFTTQAIIHQNLAEGLVTVDGQNGDLIPTLATEWEPVDDTTWRFTLREGVTFHNGEPLDGDAVVFSVTRLMDEATQSEFRGYFPAELAAEAIDEYTVEMTTGVPSPTLPRLLSFLMIVPPEHTESADGALQDLPIGTGPYEFESAGPNEVFLTRFDDYWGGVEAEVERFQLIARPESTSRTAGVSTGEIDIAADIPPQSVDQVPEHTVVPGLEVMVLRLNALRGLTADPAVREAVILGSNREELRTQILGDVQSAPAHGQLAASEVVFGFDPDLEAQEFDPERAREVLEEAGHAGAAITLVAPAGRYPQGEEYAEALALDLEQNTGLEVNLEIVDTQRWLDVLITQEEDTVEAVLVGISADQFDLSQPLGAQVRVGAVAPRFPHDAVPQVQELIEQADNAFEPDEREELLHEISAGIQEADAFNILYVANTIWGHQEDVSWRTHGAPRVDLATVSID